MLDLFRALFIERRGDRGVYIDNLHRLTEKRSQASRRVGGRTGCVHQWKAVRLAMARPCGGAPDDLFSPYLFF